MATYKPIQSIVVSSATSSITFSGIDQSYTDLILVSTMRYTSSNVGQGLQLRFNGDSSSNYSATVLEGDGSTASSYRSTSATAGIFNAPSNGSQSSFSPVILHINNYSSTTTYKSWLSRGSGPTYVDLYAGRWAATPQAITSITIIPSGTAGNIDAGCTFDLYGIKSGAPQALGGDLVTTDGNYWYHTFRSTGAFIPQKPLTVDYLVVAGGGGGGAVAAGGGGGGGLRSTVTATGGGGSLESALSLTSNINYIVTVGAGGAVAASSNTQGTSGANSVFSTITATGGGGGGSFNALAGLTGGSGGGGGFFGASGGSGTTNQGYAGQAFVSGDSSSNFISGGGGGAGATGSGGTGGNGVATSISGSSVTYAGGGGGGVGFDISARSGGSGGGGTGSRRNTSAGTSGTANTGGGGGSADLSAVAGGNGGSGIVIVRYPV